MYNTNDIQNMITTVNNDGKVDDILAHIPILDKSAVRHVLETNWVETFDRYDSDVCERFITAYERTYKGKWVLN